METYLKIINETAEKLRKELAKKLWVVIYQYGGKVYYEGTKEDVRLLEFLEAHGKIDRIPRIEEYDLKIHGITFEWKDAKAIFAAIFSPEREGDIIKAYGREMTVKSVSEKYGTFLAWDEQEKSMYKFSIVSDQYEMMYSKKYNFHKSDRTKLLFE
jgi:hypothetical protein